MELGPSECPVTVSNKLDQRFYENGARLSRSPGANAAVADRTRPIGSRPWNFRIFTHRHVSIGPGSRWQVTVGTQRRSTRLGGMPSLRFLATNGVRGGSPLSPNYAE